MRRGIIPGKYIIIALVMALALSLFFIRQTVANYDDGDFTLTEDGTQIVSYNGPGGSITVPSTVTTIPGGLFSDNITGVAGMESVETIAANAFSGQSNLTSFPIPSKLTDLSQEAFRGSGIQLFSGGSSTYPVYDGAVYAKNGGTTQLYIVPEGYPSTSFTVSANANGIAQNAFEGTGITTLHIANGDTAIKANIGIAPETIYAPSGSSAYTQAQEVFPSATVRAEGSSGGGGSGTYTVTGRVRNSDGTSATGLRVTLNDSSGSTKSTTTTGSNGTFSFSNLENGNYTIYIDSFGGHVNLTIDGENHDIGTVTLGSSGTTTTTGTGSIYGVVRTTDGAIVSGATITVSPDTRSVRTAIRSNYAGEYYIDGLTPGNYVVTASLDGESDQVGVGVTANNISYAGVLRLDLDDDDDDDDDDEDEDEDIDEDIDEEDDYIVDDDDDEDELPTPPPPTDGTGTGGHSLDTTPRTADLSVDSRFILCAGLFLVGMSAVVIAKTRSRIASAADGGDDNESDELD